MKSNEEITAIQRLLERIPRTEPRVLAVEMANNNQITVIRDTSNELIVCFTLLSKSVRLMHVKDIDKDDKKSFDKSARAKSSVQRANQLFDEEPMPTSAQQYVMATVLVDRHDDFHSLVVQETTPGAEKPTNINKSVFSTLRSLAREKYWLDMTPTERASIRQAANVAGESPELGIPLRLIKDNWFEKWNNGRWDQDYFRNYLMDQMLAVNALDLVTEDIFVVVDRNLRVVFANVENIANLLLGRLPPLPSRNQETEGHEQQQTGRQGTDSEEELESPCINFGGDHDDEGDMVWTNKMLHGPTVLPRGSGLLDSSSESSSSSE